RPSVDDPGYPREQRIVMLLRVAVVLSWALLLTLDADAAQPHRAAAWSVLAVSMSYSVLLLLGRARYAWTPPEWSMSLVDSVLTLLACALTGGADTPLVAVLPLIVIAAG